jgi:hypothetical protein
LVVSNKQQQPFQKETSLHAEVEPRPEQITCYH